MLVITRCRRVVYLISNIHVAGVTDRGILHLFASAPVVACRDLTNSVPLVLEKH